MMKRSYIFLFLSLISLFSFAQDDSLRRETIEEFVVSGEAVPSSIFSIQPLQYVPKKRMEIISSFQISEIVKHLAGTVVKDYGGIGGMKTVSVRGMGTQHTGVVYNGVIWSDVQNGQVDISKFDMEFTRSIALTNGLYDQILAPARMHSYAAVLNIYPVLHQFSKDRNSTFRFGLNTGSFYFFNPTLQWSQKIAPSKTKKWNGSAAITASLISLRGDYPFQLQYGNIGDSTSIERRKNSDLFSFQTEGSMQWNKKDNSASFLIHLFHYQSERGIPGAVIWYNPTADERLWDATQFIQAQYSHFFKSGWAYRSILKANHAYTRYLDPTFLSSEGKMDHRYSQNEFYMSQIGSYRSRAWEVTIAQDLFYNNLFANILNFPNPIRLNSLSSLNANYRYKQFHFNGTLLYTYVYNHSQKAETHPPYKKLSPALGISWQPWKQQKLHLRTFYKNIYRLPTFNDLYYREFGNLDLDPENTHQWNVGITYYTPYYRDRGSFHITLDAYYNIIENKIVAIPTRNLFVWSMQNYGIVHAKGIDLTLQNQFQFKNNSTLYFSGSYTLQKAIDLTDPENKTYGHQLPYTPIHYGSLSLSYLCKIGQFSYNLVMSGDRYSSAQNIPQNHLRGYQEQSISYGKEFPLKLKTCSPFLGFKIEMINIIGTQYEIIRNYPMPGRSFRGKITFRCE
ncbi:MAG TPA: TonB-dependent receptor [Bacteroidales bacterium]|nr:TonB-dependent receptor [Bacteroidales bacterium]HOH21974.1 TonB-dependent receptor [Bacteroidales bacterium]HPZ03495.1 TonB-dependent receptor [Bacteroidales bacterium]HQB74895.1 TonB-dependent receptor [Bacteroidales bacterium]